MPTPSISYADFCNDAELLADWHVGSTVIEGDKTYSPLQAASLACFKAVQSPAKITRVILPNRESQAETLDYLKAFFEGKPLLRQLLKRTVGSDIELTGGGAIQVTCSTVKSLRGVCATVLLVPREREELMHPTVLAQRMYFIWSNAAQGRYSEEDYKHALQLLAMVAKAGGITRDPEHLLADIGAAVERDNKRCSERLAKRFTGLGTPTDDGLPRASDYVIKPELVGIDLDSGYYTEKANRDIDQAKRDADAEPPRPPAFRRRRR